jgi:hypothetical protein
MHREREMIRKGYIRKWEKPKDPDSDLSGTTYFCEFAKDAAYWDNREIAESDCRIFNHGITIPSAEGGSFLIQNFDIEEFQPGIFVIFCHAPFQYTEK